jgi:hypothetical protein
MPVIRTMCITPLFADAIDFSVVIQYGIAILIPIFAFQFFVEGLILRKYWSVPFGALASLVFRANVFSLLAGIPTKIVNMVMYGVLLPWNDIPRFFARYPWAVVSGTLFYFAVTVFVEWLTALRWTQLTGRSLSQSSVFRGILWANVATYLVLAPLHYLGTRPTNDIKTFSPNALWTKHPEIRLVFVDPATGHLRTRRITDTSSQTLISNKVESFLISSDLKVCVYRDPTNSLHVWRADAGVARRIWQTGDRIDMNKVAFDPSGNRVAIIVDQWRIAVVETRSGKFVPATAPMQASMSGIAWSSDENRFVVSAGTNEYFVVGLVGHEATFTQVTNSSQLPPLFVCYGRPLRNWNERCGEREAFFEPGLGSRLSIYRENAGRKIKLLTLAVNPGLLHLPSVQFAEAAFLSDCNECLVEASDALYLIDVDKKRLGRIGSGSEFIAFVPKYRKQL